MLHKNALYMLSALVSNYNKLFAFLRREPSYCYSCSVPGCRRLTLLTKFSPQQVFHRLNCMASSTPPPPSAAALLPADALLRVAEFLSRPPSYRAQPSQPWESSVEEMRRDTRPKNAYDVTVVSLMRAVCREWRDALDGVVIWPEWSAEALCVGSPKLLTDAILASTPPAFLAHATSIALDNCGSGPHPYTWLGRGLVHLIAHSPQLGKLSLTGLRLSRDALAESGGILRHRALTTLAFERCPDVDSDAVCALLAAADPSDPSAGADESGTATDASLSSASANTSSATGSIEGPVQGATGTASLLLLHMIECGRPLHPTGTDSNGAVII